MNSFGQALFLTLFIALFLQSITGLVRIIRWIGRKVFGRTGNAHINAFLNVFDRMNDHTTCIKYMLSASIDQYDIFRSEKDPAFFKKEDEAKNHFPGRRLILLSGGFALVIIWVELVAGALLVNMLKEAPIVTTENVYDLDLIKIGPGRGVKEYHECTLNGILVDDGTRLEDDSVMRRDVRLDTLGVYDLSNLSSLISGHPVWAKLSRVPEGDLVELSLTNKKGFGAGLRMRASITGLDGVARSYKMYEGSWGNNPGIIDVMEKIAEELGVEVIGNVEYVAGSYWANTTLSFVLLQDIINDISRLYCKIFTVGKIHDSANIMSVDTELKMQKEFPDWFWGTFVGLAVLALGTSILGLGEFDDFEQLVILSKDVREQDHCLDAPIQDFAVTDNLLGYTTGPDPQHVHFGYTHNRVNAVIEDNHDYIVN